MNDEATKLLSVTAAARAIGIAPNTLRAWTEKGLVHAARLPGRGDRRYTLAEIQRVRRDVIGVEEGSG